MSPLHPDSKGHLITTIEATHNAIGFAHRLKEYLNTHVLKPLTARRTTLAPLPFERVDIYHQFKVFPMSVDDDLDGEETVKATPRTPLLLARSDTVLVLVHDKAEAAGLHGWYIVPPLLLI